MLKRLIKRLLLAFALLTSVYGGGRLYYSITDGFVESNIHNDQPYEARWELPPLNEEEKALITEILSQDFYYLGKGCQSYVFQSNDDKYVIKFFKYQRMRPQFWLEYLAFIPQVNSYIQKKALSKKEKLDTAYASWKLAYEDLKEESGVLYVHFNKKAIWQQEIALHDKMGTKHLLMLDNLEFMIQKKGEMLCDVLIRHKQNNSLPDAFAIVDNLVEVLISEYQRGYADNDHALMQNTGVFAGAPMHIDVGQFIKNSIVKTPDVYKQELFNKMWKFRLWLDSELPEVKAHLDAHLEMVIGPEFSAMQPHLYKGGVARIPFE